MKSAKNQLGGEVTFTNRGNTNQTVIVRVVGMIVLSDSVL